MSGIARILLDRGGQVSGSDAKESRGVLALRARGALIRIGHDASSLDLLPGGPTAVVTTHAAIPKNNPELVEARRRGIPVILRPVVLAKLMAGYTHADGHRHARQDDDDVDAHRRACSTADSTRRSRSAAISARRAPTRTTAAATASSPRPTRATARCSSTRPDVAVVTNIEADHLDFFGSAEAYAAVFDDFVERLRARRRAGGLHRRPGRGGAGRARRGAGDPGAALRQRRGRTWPAQAAELGAAGHRRGRTRPAGRRDARRG